MSLTSLFTYKTTCHVIPKGSNGRPATLRRENFTLHAEVALIYFVQWTMTDHNSLVIELSNLVILVPAPQPSSFLTRTKLNRFKLSLSFGLPRTFRWIAGGRDLGHQTARRIAGPVEAATPKRQTS